MSWRRGRYRTALKRLFELEWKALGMEEKLALQHEGKLHNEVSAAADAAWVLDYVRQLGERSADDGQPEG